MRDVFKSVRSRLASGVATAVLVLVSVGCASDEQVIQQAAGFHQQLEPAIVTSAADPELDDYVQQVGDRIVAAAKRMYENGELDDYEPEPWMFENVQFHLVASPQLNAFTTGGQHVYLYTRLLEEAGSEAGFAAVVGHEFGHIIGRHVHDGMNKQMGTMLAGLGIIGTTALLSDDDTRAENTAIASAAAGAGGMAAVTYFSRDNEREADALGYEFYIRAGYPPERFADFFKRLIAESGGGGGDLTGFFSTHPQLADRVEAAARRASRTPLSAVQKFDQPPIAGASRYAGLIERSRPLTARAAQEANRPGTALHQATAILAAFPSCLASDAADPPPPTDR
jgi:predicted Zn-dependent protease